MDNPNPKRFRKRWFVLAAVLAWLILMATGWLPRPTDVQRKSVALIEAPPVSAKGSRNAFAALWYSPYEVAPAEMDRMMQADVARFRLRRERSIDLHPSPEGVLQNQMLDNQEAKVLCRPSIPVCLAHVAQHREETRAVLVRHAALLERLRALHGYDHVHYLFPPAYDAPLPSLGNHGPLLDTDAALRFVEGDRAEGLSRACASAATWRRFALHSDHLITQMVASVYFQGSAQRVGEMLAHFPRDAALPADCTEAFTPAAPSASDLCDSLKIEYQSAQNSMSSLVDKNDPMWNSPEESRKPIHFGRALVTTGMRLVLHPQPAVTMMAPTYAAFCTGDRDVRDEAVRLRDATAFGYCGIQGEMFNPLGCYMAHQFNPGTVDRYPARFNVLFDANRLVRASLAQRGGAGAADYAKGTSDVVVDRAHELLSVRRSATRPNESPTITIPIPGSRLPGNPATASGETH